MTPILRRALQAAVSIALWSAPAFSCRLCENPPQVAPAQLAPEEPFNLSTPPGLLPGELDYLLAAEGARFSLKSPYLIDAKAADAQRHLATAAQIQAWLQTRSEARVRQLRSKLAAGDITEPDRTEALVLFWYRGPLLSDSDRKFLESLIPLTLGRVPPQPTGAGPSPSVRLAPADDLLARLRRQVELVGNAEQKVALREAAALLLASPMGRQLAAEFIATGARARVEFEAIPGTRIVEENGKKKLLATMGQTSIDRGRICVGINQDFLKTDHVYQQQQIAMLLAHELFGHGLEGVKAKKAGVEEAYDTYRDNETNARLNEWIMAAELGADPDDPYLWQYLRDPADFYRSIELGDDYYAVQFSPAQAQDAVSVLHQRLEQAQKNLDDLPQSIADWKGWRPVIEHFITIHKLSRDSFRSLIEDIDNQVNQRIPSISEDLGSIIKTLNEKIAWYQSRKGKAQLRRMKQLFAQDYFVRHEAQIQTRRAKLEGLMRGKAAPTDAPPAGQVTWRELGDMYSQDRTDNPEHWKK